MFKVTINGEQRDFYSLEYALTDLFSRGFESPEWTLEKVVDES